MIGMLCCEKCFAVHGALVNRKTRCAVLFYTACKVWVLDLCFLTIVINRKFS